MLIGRRAPFSAREPVIETPGSDGHPDRDFSSSYPSPRYSPPCRLMPEGPVPSALRGHPTTPWQATAAGRPPARRASRTSGPKCEGYGTGYCPAGYTYEAVFDSCVTCPTGTNFNPLAGNFCSAPPICPPGFTNIGPKCEGYGTGYCPSGLHLRGGLRLLRHLPCGDELRSFSRQLLRNARHLSTRDDSDRVEVFRRVQADVPRRHGYDVRHDL